MLEEIFSFFLLVVSILKLRLVSGVTGSLFAVLFSRAAEGSVACFLAVKAEASAHALVSFF